MREQGGGRDGRWVAVLEQTRVQVQARIDKAGAGQWSLEHTTARRQQLGFHYSFGAYKHVQSWLMLPSNSYNTFNKSLSHTYEIAVGELRHGSAKIHSNMFQEIMSDQNWSFLLLEWHPHVPIVFALATTWKLYGRLCFGRECAPYIYPLPLSSAVPNFHPVNSPSPPFLPYFFSFLCNSTIQCWCIERIPISQMTAPPNKKQFRPPFPLRSTFPSSLERLGYKFYVSISPISAISLFFYSSIRFHCIMKLDGSLCRTTWTTHCIQFALLFSAQRPRRQSHFTTAKWLES